ncbi:hypothetical protein CCR75_002605 [Bremia lactucae]|uniref:Uncharacterized protein n=1 Tax=Bremia lactucae TaxID=4779 RepID=A0A976ILI1_BRELC|nr:hypothetical protein CCR75_002605 [Bremia lactucae]
MQSRRSYRLLKLVPRAFLVAAIAKLWIVTVGDDNRGTLKGTETAQPEKRQKYTPMQRDRRL